MSTKKSSPRRTTKKSTKTTRVSVAKARGKKCAPPNKPLCVLAIIILGIAAVVALSAMMIFSSVGMNNKFVQTDAERFSAEYSTVSVDNPFVYKTADEVAKIIENGTGAVFMGFPSCPWCQAYAGYLAEAAKDAGLETIYYYNIESDRSNNTEAYQKIVNLLGGSLQYDEEGNRRIYVPDVAFVVDGRIIGNDLESSKDTAGESDPAAYWTAERVDALKNRLKTYMQQLVAAGCNDACNK